MNVKNSFIWHVSIYYDRPPKPAAGGVEGRGCVRPDRHAITLHPAADGTTSPLLLAARPSSHNRFLYYNLVSPSDLYSYS